MKSSFPMFRVLILLACAGAICFAQRSYTATPIAISGYQSAGLNWISDDGKTGFGYGLIPNTFSTQCFTYSDGVTTPLLTPAPYCTGIAAAQGNFLIKLATDSTPSGIGVTASYQLFVYKGGQYSLLQQPDGVRLLTGVPLTGINVNGQIATTFLCPAPSGAYSLITTLPCAYAVSNTGVFARLPDLGGSAYATAINNNGDIAGWVSPLSASATPSTGSVIVWSQGVMKTLDSSGLPAGVPTAMNSKGQIVGGAAPNAQLTVVGSGYFYDGLSFNPVQVPGSSKTVPASINDSGEVVGNYQNKSDINDHPFYYSNGVAADLNALVTNFPASRVITSALYINNSGQILVNTVDLSLPAGSVASGLALSQYLLTPANSTVSAPLITGVVNGASFVSGITSSSLVTIEGASLSSTTRQWGDSDFSGASLPTSIDGVSVTINGIKAYPTFVSPTQINVVAPDDSTTGPVQVQVTNSNGASNLFTVTKTDLAPAFFVIGSKYAAALHANGSFVGSAGFLGGNFSPAKPGETIQLYGTGFGPTVPASPAGQIVTQAVQLANPVTVTIGGVPAQVTYAGRTASGTDQLNVTVPISLVPDGDFNVQATVNGIKTPANVPIPVKFQ